MLKVTGQQADPGAGVNIFFIINEVPKMVEAAEIGNGKSASVQECGPEAGSLDWRDQTISHSSVNRMEVAGFTVPGG
jgi:hypothetical protein